MMLSGRTEISENGVLALEPLEEEPLDDLAQLRLGLLRREQDRGRGWLQSVQRRLVASWRKRSGSIAIGRGEAGTQALG
jgi:hypothetical protein